MTRGRLEAFSDGVIAILITIMVLELKVPQGVDATTLRPMIPTLLSYLLSFVFLAIYWNNHHHLLQTTQQVDGRVLWANMNLLFWLSLIPVVTAWMGRSHGAALPVAIYGAVLILAGIAFTILVRALVALHGPESLVAKAIGQDVKGKVSLLLYAVAIPLAFVRVWIAAALYVTVAIIWLVPDPRMERALSGSRVIE